MIRKAEDAISGVMCPSIVYNKRQLQVAVLLTDVP